MNEHDKIAEIYTKVNRILVILDGDSFNGGLVTDHQKVKGSLKRLWKIVIGFTGAGISIGTSLMVFLFKFRP